MDGDGDQAAINYRPILGRLSVDTGYEACTGATSADPRKGLFSGAADAHRALLDWQCSPRPLPGTATFRLLRFRGTGEAESELHKLGLVSLLWQSEARLERAVQRLSMASEVSAEPNVLSDLSAARIALALERDRPRELLASYVAASAAIVRDPEHRPAAFNRALALELLGLTEAASGAWVDYITLDEQSGWTSEARRRRDGLLEPRIPDLWRLQVLPRLEENLTRVSEATELDRVVVAYPQQAREYIQRKLLPEWASERDESTARESLGKALALTESLSRVTGDSLLSRELQYLQGLDEGEELRSARTAHRLLDKGFLALYGEWDLRQARTAFSGALERFRSLNSPMALWARFLLALTDYYEQSHELAAESLRQLAPEAERASSVLSARVSWVRGLVGSGLGDLQAAIQGYRDALAGFRELGEVENQTVLHAYLAHSYSEIGDETKWSRHAHSALAGIAHVANPVRRYAILETLVMILRRRGDEEAALLLAGEQVRAALMAEGAPLRQSAFMRRATIHIALGNASDALADLSTAQLASQEIDDPRLRARVEADQDLLAAELKANSAPAEAVELASRTLTSYQATDFALLEPRALAARGRALGVLGRHEEALADFLAELTILEQRRSSLVDDLTRGSFQREMREAFNRAIRVLALQLGRPEEAMALAARARVWPDHPSQRRPLASLKDENRDPPVGTVAVQYALLGADLCLWARRRGSPVLQHCHPGVAGEIEGLAYLMISNLSRRAAHDSKHEREASRLYQLLIAPLGPSLVGANRLVVSADGPVHLVPFPALLSNGRLLLEDLEIEFRTDGPGTWTKRGVRSRDAPGSLLAVFASPDPGDPDLPPLPRSRAEAAAVAAAYQGGAVVNGSSLTRQALLERLEQVSALHFAGHTTGVEEEGDLQLVLSSGPSGVTVRAADLKGYRFPGLELVFLSACRSTGVGAEALPGPLGLLARRFLLAGAGAVVGSSWDISDSTAYQIATAFHAARSRGDAPSTALRRAQLMALAKDSTGDWAFFRVYVG